MSAVDINTNKQLYKVGLDWGGVISSAGQCCIMVAKNILHRVLGELRTTSAIPFLAWRTQNGLGLLWPACKRLF